MATMPPPSFRVPEPAETRCDPATYPPESRAATNTFCEKITGSVRNDRRALSLMGIFHAWSLQKRDEGTLLRREQPACILPWNRRKIAHIPVFCAPGPEGTYVVRLMAAVADPPELRVEWDMAIVEAVGEGHQQRAERAAQRLRDVLGPREAFLRSMQLFLVGELPDLPAMRTVADMRARLVATHAPQAPEGEAGLGMQAPPPKNRGRPKGRKNDPPVVMASTKGRRDLKSLGLSYLDQGPSSVQGPACQQGDGSVQGARLPLVPGLAVEEEAGATREGGEAGATMEGGRAAAPRPMEEEEEGAGPSRPVVEEAAPAPMEVEAAPAEEQQPGPASGHGSQTPPASTGRQQSPGARVAVPAPRPGGADGPPPAGDHGPAAAMVGASTHPDQGEGQAVGRSDVQRVAEALHGKATTRALQMAIAAEALGGEATRRRQTKDVPLLRPRHGPAPAPQAEVQQVDPRPAPPPPKRARGPIAQRYLVRGPGPAQQPAPADPGPTSPGPAASTARSGGSGPLVLTTGRWVARPTDSSTPRETSPQAPAPAPAAEPGPTPASAPRPPSPPASPRPAPGPSSSPPGSPGPPAPPAPPGPAMPAAAGPPAGHPAGPAPAPSADGASSPAGPSLAAGMAGAGHGDGAGSPPPEDSSARGPAPPARAAIASKRPAPGLLPVAPPLSAGVPSRGRGRGSPTKRPRLPGALPRVLDFGATPSGSGPAPQPTPPRVPDPPPRGKGKADATAAGTTASQQPEPGSQPAAAGVQGGVSPVTPLLTPPVEEAGPGQPPDSRAGPAEATRSGLPGPETQATRTPPHSRVLHGPQSQPTPPPPGSTAAAGPAPRAPASPSTSPRRAGSAGGPRGAPAGAVSPRVVEPAPPVADTVPAPGQPEAQPEEVAAVPLPGAPDPAWVGVLGLGVTLLPWQHGPLAPMTIVSTPVPEGGAPFRTGLDADYAHPIEYGDGYWGEEAECVPPSPGREAGPALWDPAGLPIPSSREMDLAMAYNLGHPNPYPFTGRAPRSRAQGAPLRPRSPSPPAELPLPFVPGLEPGCYAGSRTLVRAASPPEAVRAAGLVNDVDYESLGYERMDSVEVSGDGNCFLYALSAHLHAQDFHSLAHGKDPTREGLRAPEYLEMMNTRQAQLRRQVCDHIRAACQGDGERGSEFLSVFRHSGMWDHLQPQQARECIGPVGDPAGRTLEDYLWLMGSPSLGVWTPSEFVAEAAKCFRVDILCFVRNLGRPAGRAPVRLDTYLSGAPPGTRVRQVFVEFLHYDGASGHYNALWPRGVPYGPTRFWHRATGPAPSAPVVLLSVSSAASRSSRATESLGPPGEQVGAARTPPDGRGEDEANTPAAPPAARGEGPPAGPPDPRAVRAFRREAGRPALLTQRRAHRPTGRLRGRPGRLERQPAERARLPPGVDGEGEFSTASSDTDWDTEGAGRVYRKVNGRGMWGWTVPATHPRYAREDHRPLWRDAGVLSEVSEYVVRNQHRRACDIRGSDDVASVTTTEWLRRAALADPGDLRDAPFLTGWDGHVLGGSEVPRHLLVDDMLDMDTFVWTGPLVDSLRRHLKCLAPVSESREAPSGIPANLKVYSHRAPGETELLSLDPGPRIRKLRKRAGRAADFGPSALLGSLSGGETSDQVFLYVDTAASEGAFRVLFAVLRYCLSDGPAADLGSHVAAGNTGGSVTPSNTQHMRNSLHTRPERACYIPGSGNKLYGRHELRRFADVMQDDRVLEHVLAPESEEVREEVRQLWPTHCRLLVLSFFRRRSLCERRHRPLRCTQHENYANDLTKDQAVGEAHAILGQYLELDTDAADVYGALWIGADLQLGVTRKDDLGQWLFCRADVERLDLRGMPAARFLEPRYMQRAGLALLLPDGLARSQFRGCRANLYNWGGSKVLGVGVEGQTPASEVWAATSPVARRRTPMPEGVCDFLVGRHRRKVLRHGREWAALASSYRGDSVQFIIYNGMPAHVKKTQPIINGSAVHEAISTLVAYGANAHCVVPGTMHKRGEVVVNKLFTALGLMSREGNPLRVELGIPLRAQSGTGGVPPQLTLRQCAANALVAVNERIRALDCTKLRCVPWADMLQIWWAYAKQWKAAHDMLVERPRPFPMPHGVAEHFYRGMGAMTVVLNANLERWHATNWRTIAERTGQLGAPCLDAFRVKVLLGHEAVRGLTPLKNLRRQMHLVVRRVQRSKGSARVLLASVAELLVQAFPVDEMWPLQAHELSRCLAPILKLYAYEALTNTREHTIVHMDLLTFRGHDPDVLPEAHPYDGHEPLDWKVPRLRQLVYLQAGGVEGRGRGELASAARPGGAWVGYLRGDSAWDMLADPVAGDAMRGKARHAIAEQSAARQHSPGSGPRCFWQRGPEPGRLNAVEVGGVLYEMSLKAMSQYREQPGRNEPGVAHMLLAQLAAGLLRVQHAEVARRRQGTAGRRRPLNAKALFAGAFAAAMRARRSVWFPISRYAPSQRTLPRVAVYVFREGPQETRPQGPLGFRGLPFYLERCCDLGGCCLLRQRSERYLALSAVRLRLNDWMHADLRARLPRLPFDDWSDGGVSSGPESDWDSITTDSDQDG